MQADHQAHRTGRATVGVTAQRREGGLKLLPLNLVGQLHQRMPRINELFGFDAKQIALGIGVRGVWWLHGLQGSGLFCHKQMTFSNGKLSTPNVAQNRLSVLG